MTIISYSLSSTLLFRIYDSPGFECGYPIVETPLAKPRMTDSFHEQ